MGGGPETGGREKEGIGQRWAVLCLCGGVGEGGWGSTRTTEWADLRIGKDQGSLEWQGQAISGWG